MRTFGFLGLGQMGGPMAANVANAGFELWVFDPAGTAERAPPKAKIASDLEDVFRKADTVFISVPNGAVSKAIAADVAKIADRKASVVIDLSTVGVDAARACHDVYKAINVEFIDAPVSGGRKGAIAGSITVMASGSKVAFDAHLDVFKAFAGKPFHVGDRPGQGQVLKTLNNYLSGTAMAATSEAVLFGLAHGLDMKTVLDVVNVSSGVNSATLDKFPNRVLTETFDAGFATRLITKDVALFVDGAKKAETPHRVADVVSSVWEECLNELPDSDFTRIFTHIKDK